MIVVYDEFVTRHLAGVEHPESPDRVAGVAAHLVDERLFGERMGARDATDDELTLVHPAAYLARVARDVESLGPSAGYLSTGDTVIDGTSLAVARRAAGGAVVAMEAAVAGDTAAFALIRPPGHHAEPARGMGFCIFSNAAVAAHVFVRQTGGRALIVDFDYHHGNGTQAAASGGVSFVSTHGYPAYPMTGGPDEQSIAERWAVVNVPLPPHRYGTEPFVATWQRALPEIARRVRPDLIVVSAGYDFATGDPVGDLGADGPQSAYALSSLIREVAAEHCRGRVAYCLEGGYDVDTLARSVAATLRAHDAPAASAERADPAAIGASQRALLERVEQWQT
ncbi:MAG: histone deacetylase [Candidatus Eremiobacteraeota bacterium]|nr:histone deacetylase [Candidatus Eremiobacteraeota bacterium]